MNLCILFCFFLCTLALPPPPPTVVISAILRDFANSDSDFTEAHPDFNSDVLHCNTPFTTGMVAQTLGQDRKPVYQNSTCITSVNTFSQWYRDVPGVNYPSTFDIIATYNAQTESYVYNNTNFFPIDDQYYGNEGYPHNYGFTLEFHTKFTYEQGQVFSFTGDDDIWVFIDDNLVIDLGGLHPARSAVTYLDELDLIEGQVYTFDLFFAERHFDLSDIIFSTSIIMSPCGYVDTDGDGVADLCDDCPTKDLWVTGDIPTLSYDMDISFTVSVLGEYQGDGYTLVVDYGDDTPSFSLEGKEKNVSLNHTYSQYGQYLVVLKLQNVGTGCKDVSNTFTLTISNPCGDTDTDGDGLNDKCDNCPEGPLTLSLTVPTTTSSILVPIVTSVGNIFTGDTYDLSFDFGDGSKFFEAEYSYNVNKVHLYPKSGAYNVVVSLSDAGNGCNTVEESAVVTIGNRKAPKCPNTLLY